MKDKMKKAGYGCIGFAMILSVIALIPYFKIEINVALPLIQFWGAIMGMGMLFGNAGKRIAGSAVMNKSPLVTGGDK